jgi:hypothetical protein
MEMLSQREDSASIQVNARLTVDEDRDEILPAGPRDVGDDVSRRKCANGCGNDVELPRYKKGQHKGQEKPVRAYPWCARCRRRLKSRSAEELRALESNPGLPDSLRKRLERQRRCREYRERIRDADEARVREKAQWDLDGRKGEGHLRECNRCRSCKAATELPGYCSNCLSGEPNDRLGSPAEKEPTWWLDLLDDPESFIDVRRDAGYSRGHRVARPEDIADQDAVIPGDFDDDPPANTDEVWYPAPFTLNPPFLVASEENEAAQIKAELRSNQQDILAIDWSHRHRFFRVVARGRKWSSFKAPMNPDEVSRWTGLCSMEIWLSVICRRLESWSLYQRNKLEAHSISRDLKFRFTPETLICRDDLRNFLREQGSSLADNAISKDKLQRWIASELETAKDDRGQWLDPMCRLIAERQELLRLLGRIGTRETTRQEHTKMESSKPNPPQTETCTKEERLWLDYLKPLFDAAIANQELPELPKIAEIIKNRGFSKSWGYEVLAPFKRLSEHVPNTKATGHRE